jgi:hypothetical protein
VGQRLEKILGVSLEAAEYHLKHLSLYQGAGQVGRLITRSFVVGALGSNEIYWIMPWNVFASISMFFLLPLITRDRGIGDQLLRANHPA